jgi:ferric-dicitrate binding protein FerR (iron transport regulator)
MKIDEHNQQHARKLARYLGGEMNEMEFRTFEDEIAGSEENKIMIEEMKKQWSDIKGYTEAKVPDTFKAWEKLHGRLSADNLIPAGNRMPKVSVVPTLLRAAAVVIILLGVGAVLYFNINRKPVVEMVQLNTGNETNTLIKTLTDGSVIYIAENSLFTFPKEFEEKSRNVELKGEAFFDIIPNPDKPFIIETDEAVIQVLGTAFNVNTHNGKGFELFVDRGKVRVTLKKDPSHTELVVAGEKITSVKNNLVKSKHVVNQSYTWYKQRMHFKDEALQDIINVLNRNFNTTFVVAEKETGNRKMTVTFNNETATTMTELLCVTLNLKSQNINGSVVLSENKEEARQN